jgi:hypothetical protein
MNTGQALNSNRFQSSKSANYKEIRCNAANFNEFLKLWLRTVLECFYRYNFDYIGRIRFCSCKT